MANYYPLAVLNEWHYKLKDRSTYVNKVTAASGNEFTMHNSSVDKSNTMKKDAAVYTTDAFEATNFQKWLSDDLKPGDSWEIKFKANGLDCILIMTVKEQGISKEVEGKTYTDVLMVEAENKIVMNGTLMPLNFFTQYYYAEGIGLILTTSSAGDSHALIDYKLN